MNKKRNIVKLIILYFLIFSLVLVSCKANFNDNNIVDDIENETTKELTEEEKFKIRFIGNLDNEKYKFLKDDLVDEIIEDENNNSTYDTQKLENNQILGKNGWVYHITEVEKRILMNEDVTNEDWYELVLTYMNKLEEIAKEQNKEIYYVLTPWKDLVYDEYLPDEYKEKVNDENDMDLYYEYIKKNSDIKFIYPKKELIDAKKYFRSFYTIDSHWNKLGGFLVANLIYDMMGIDINAIDTLDIKPIEYSSYGKYDYDFDYKGRGEVLNEEIHGTDRANSRVIVSESNSNLDKEITIIGDSFRFWLYDIFKKDFKKASTINRGSLGSTLQTEIIKNSDVIVVEIITDYFYDIIRTIEFIMKNIN